MRLLGGAPALKLVDDSEDGTSLFSDRADESCCFVVRCEHPFELVQPGEPLQKGEARAAYFLEQCSTNWVEIGRRNHCPAQRPSDGPVPELNANSGRLGPFAFAQLRPVCVEAVFYWVVAHGDVDEDVEVIHVSHEAQMHQELASAPPLAESLLGLAKAHG